MLDYLVREGGRLGREAIQRVSTPQKLVGEKSQLRKEFRFMIGLDPLPKREPLELSLVRTIECDGYAVDVIHFQSMPKLYVTANLYRPTNLGSGPYPAVILGPGHTPHPSGGKAVRQNYAVPWVREGYIALVIDPIQVAEIFAVHRGTDSFRMWDWYARGYTPIGVEVWNAMRAVDYLLTRPDVDGSKLVVNGCSGGGHLSWMLAAADERIAMSQPVAGTGDILSHISDNLVRLHCDCAYFINTYRHDWSTLAALIAPRPLLIHATTEDVYYPPKSYHSVFESAKTIYKCLGEADRVGLSEDTGPHNYTDTQRNRAVQWGNKWFRGDKSLVKTLPFDEIPAEQLAAFDQSLPKSINARIHEQFIPQAEIPSCSNLAEWERIRQTTLDKLKTVVFRNLPRPYKAYRPERKLRERYSLETEEGIQVGMSSQTSPTGVGNRALLYIASPNDSPAGIRNLLRSYPWQSLPVSTHIIWPRGIGTLSWDDMIQQRIRRSAMLLGRTLDDMRVFDILCAIDLIASQPDFDDGDLTVVGEGEAGILGVYAALLDTRVTRIILKSPPISHKNGPVLLNILRYCDIPQALAMLAPRELILLSDCSNKFDFAKTIYRLYGVEANFKTSQTITQVLHERLNEH
ncbi:alpha/beta hydrolase [Bythopirellula goksoeyrii]|nr:hypothetical protein [Bythopirellula goksoeyrii]